MKRLIIFTIILSCLYNISYGRMGDNMGNHEMSKNLDVAGFNIFNGSGDVVTIADDLTTENFIAIISSACTYYVWRGTFTSGYTFADGGEGLHSPEDSVIRMFINNTDQINLTGTWFGGMATNDFIISHSQGLSYTAPVFTWIGDINTGIGHGATDQFSLIANGIEVIKVATTTVIIDANTYTTGISSVSGNSFIDDNLKVNGDIDSWCSVRIATNVATVLDANKWTSITGNWSQCNLVDFTRSISTVTYTYADDGQWFLFTIDITVQVPGGAGSVVDIGLSKNGDDPVIHRTITLSGAEEDGLGIHCVIQGDQDDTFNPVIREVNGDDATVVDGSFLMWSR